MLTPQEQFAKEQAQVAEALDAQHIIDHPEKYTRNGNPREKYRAPGSVHDKKFLDEQQKRRKK